MGKAQTSALTKRPSKFFEDRVKERPGFVTFPTPGVMFQGGVPIVHQGECVGAIGVSGVQSHEDEQVRRPASTRWDSPLPTRRHARLDRASI
jgi:glc operon protein GlcG